LKNYPVAIADKILMNIVRGYTKEAGVRELERLMNTISRKIATEVVTEDVKEGRKFKVDEKNIEKYLGPIKYDRTGIEDHPQIGLVNGLAWTSVGGELLNIEVVTVPGNGKIQVTGNLKEVMRESASAALSYVRSISGRLGVDHEWYSKNDIHIHVPDGATPKDGPSAGVTMATALTSAIAGIPVRQDVAMTGEISLRGRVLPIGGLKEKILAAKQAGITTVIIPKKNEKDLVKIPAEIMDGMEIRPVFEAEEVLRIALNLTKPEEFMKVRALKVLEGESNLEVAN
jgi:ATP-dependent Lon protease